MGAPVNRRVAAVLLACSGCVPCLSSAAEGSSALAALITDTRLAEISGMAASSTHADVLWAHNDSGDDSHLFAIDRDGEVRGALAIDGVENVDWEDMAAFEHDGAGFLVVADTGDNGGIRDVLELHVIAEPQQLAADGRASPAWTVRFRWPDGARDCEAIAVDAVGGYIYLVAKKRVPPEAWRVPLRPDGGEPVTAERVGLLSGVVQPSAADLERNPVYGRYRSQITAIDISADGRRFAALNYRTAYVFVRAAGEDWGAALARDPLELLLPWLPQAEALAFDRDGRSVWISSEKLPAPLLQVQVPLPPAAAGAR